MDKNGENWKKLEKLEKWSSWLETTNEEEILVERVRKIKTG